MGQAFPSTGPRHRQKGPPVLTMPLRSESVTAFGNTHATGLFPVSQNLVPTVFSAEPRHIVNLGMEHFNILVLLHLRHVLGACVGYENDRVVG